jgi:hypothetical protein
MTEEETIEMPAKTQWAISPDWLQQNNRSIVTLLKNYLCPECVRRFDTEGKESSYESLLTTIYDCCSHSKDFLSDKLPVLESIFRFFLSNRNTPVTTEELAEQLEHLHGGNAYHNSPEVLLRILRADIYYGVRELPCSNNS